MQNLLKSSYCWKSGMEINETAEIIHQIVHWEIWLNSGEYLNIGSLGNKINKPLKQHLLYKQLAFRWWKITEQSWSQLTQVMIIDRWQGEHDY